MIITSFLIAILIVTFGYVLQRLCKHYSYWSRAGIASESPHWLMGNLQGVMQTTTILESTLEFYKKFKNSGPFVGYYWFTKPAVFALDPSLIKNILIKDFSNFTDRGMFVNEEDDPLSGHLVNLEGAKWRSMRNKLSPTFTSGKMKIMFPLLTKVGHEFVTVFREIMESNEVVEVRDLAARFTCDVIGVCAFGIKTSSLQNPKSEFRTMGRRALTERWLGTLGMGFRFNFPQLARKLHMRDTMPDVENFFMQISKETVEYREKNNVRHNDFMDMLIDLKNNRLLKSETGEKLSNLTMGEIAAQAFVFLVAGFETSSTTISFALYELAQHQKAQQNAREEVIMVLERHNQELTYECLKELVYLEQVINETLRLYTVVPIINRLALEDYIVPDHPKYVIRKGMLVVIPAAAIHREERYYPQPDVFNPDNFSLSKMAKRDSILHLPFGDGPRNCIGMRFGKMQAIVGLALLLKNFQFSICDQTTIPMTYENKNFMVSAKNGIHLKVKIN